MFLNFLYTCERIGYNWWSFTLYKIKTLSDTTSWSCKEITLSPFHSKLRKYGIDEIPQCINLILWDISFFWVRPLQKEIFEQNSDWFKKRYISKKPWILWPQAISQYLWEIYEWERHNNIYMRLNYKKEMQWGLELIKFRVFIVVYSILQIIDWHEQIEN